VRNEGLPEKASLFEIKAESNGVSRSGVADIIAAPGGFSR